MKDESVIVPLVEFLFRCSVCKARFSVKDQLSKSDDIIKIIECPKCGTKYYIKKTKMEFTKKR